MEVQTIQKYIHTTPRKLRLVADMVRGMSPDQSLNILEITPKAAALPLSKAIKAVLANAKQKGIEPGKLIFKKIEINESMKMRRFRAGTRGRVKPYKRRMSHIKIVISDEIIQKTRKTQKVSVPENQTVGIPDSSDKSDTPSNSESSEKRKDGN